MNDHDYTCIQAYIFTVRTVTHGMSLWPVVGTRTRLAGALPCMDGGESDKCACGCCQAVKSEIVRHTYRATATHDVARSCMRLPRFIAGEETPSVKKTDSRQEVLGSTGSGNPVRIIF